MRPAPVATWDDCGCFYDHVLDVQRLIADGADGADGADDFSESFDYEQPPTPVHFVFRPGVESASTKASLKSYLREHPDAADDDT